MTWPRGLHWLTVRLPEYRPSAEMIEVLALQPLPAVECGSLGVLLDLAEDSAERLGRPDPLGFEDRRLSGRRIAHPPALLDDVEQRAAS